MTALNNSESHIKSITSQIRCTNFVNIALGCTHKEVLFVSLEDLDNICISLDEDNDLVEEITHLINEVFLFSSLKKTHNQSGSKYT